MHYNLSLEDLSLCKTKKSKNNQLTFGIILAYFKVHTKFPSDKTNIISTQLVLAVAQQLAIDPIKHFGLIEWKSRTLERYRQEIRKYLGYRISTVHDGTHIIDYLVNQLIPQHLPESVLLEQLRMYFVKNKIEIVSSKQLEYYISSATQKFEQQFIRKIFNHLTQEQLVLIDLMLETDSTIENEVIELSELKKDIAGAKIKNIQGAIDKINLLQQIKLPESIVDSVNRKFLLKYYERVMAFVPSNIKDFAPMTKYVTMAVFCHIRLELILDSLTDTMIKLLKKLKSSAEKYVDNYILQEVKRVDGKFDILGKLAVLNVENPKSVIEDKIYPTVSKAKLKEVIVDLQHRGNKWYQGQVREKMYSTYTYGSRRSLLAIIRTLQIFEENIDYKPIIDAIGFINKYWDESDSPYYINIPPLNGVIPKGWRHIVVSVTKDKLCIHKYNYELAVFEQLKKLLGFKAIWVDGSYRYRNPNKDLPKDFYEKKEEYYESLGLPLGVVRLLKMPMRAYYNCR